MKFPELPPAKIYGEMMTPEQTVVHKLIQRQEITKEEEDILREAIEYYKQLYPFLKNIDLSIISDEDVVEPKRYTERAINTIIYPKNTIHFQRVFRVTLVRDEFLQDDKVREIKFVSFPPLEIITEQGIYGRANSPESTVFYCAFDPGVAVLETKPKVGDRIILTEWENFENKPFVSCPVTNNKTIDNEGLKAATAAFEETKKYNHPLFAEIMDLYFEFFSSQLVKDGEVHHPKKYEYLFSGLFADRALEYGTVAGQEDQAERPTHCTDDTIFVLISPIKSKTIEDAYLQSLVFDKRKICILQPYLADENDIKSLRLKPFFPTWQHYYKNYSLALDAVIKEGLNRNYVLNSKARGVLFLLRHSFELCLKRNLELIGVQPPIVHGYTDLYKLFSDPDFIPAGFIEAVALIDFDESGASFRYYFNKEKKQPYFKFKDTLEVAEVLRTYNRIPNGQPFYSLPMGDKLNYDSRKIKWDLTFHVGHTSHLGAIRSEYTGTVELILSLIMSKQLVLQQVYLPLLFMIRHSMELILKSNITDIQELSKLIKAEDFQNEHSLARLFTVYNNYLDKVDTKKFPKELLEQYNDYRANYAKLNAAIHQLDYHSRQFRYPVDKDGNAQNIDFNKVDFVEILKLLYYTQPFIMFMNVVMVENGILI